MDYSIYPLEIPSEIGLNLECIAVAQKFILENRLIPIAKKFIGLIRRPIEQKIMYEIPKHYKNLDFSILSNSIKGFARFLKSISIILTLLKRFLLFIFLKFMFDLLSY